MGRPLRLAYLVSRFPAASETFVVRELNEVDRAGLELSLLSLFPSKDDFLHPEAERWADRLRRPGARAAALSLGRWLIRRPLRTLTSVAVVAWACRRSHRILWRSLLTVALAADHARFLERRSIDHVHAHFASYPTLAAWVCWRLAGISYSFTAHAYDIFVDQSMLARKVGDAEFVVTISDFNRRFLAAYGGGRRTPVEVVHCGVDPALYEFRPRAVPAEGPIRALCVASLQEKKGHAVLLEALAEDERLASIELELAGGGELRDSLQALATELGLGSRVRFLGPCAEPEVRELLDAADLFVLPSIRTADGQMEGLPVALIEALACGVPTASTRLSGIPELIEDGVTGVLAEPADARSLAEALALLVGGSVRPDAERGRRLVEEEFDVTRSGARMAELFRSAPTGSGI